MVCFTCKGPCIFHVFLHLCQCQIFTSELNTVSILIQTQMYAMSLEPFSTIVFESPFMTIDTMLNCDIDTNANVTCEHGCIF